MSTLVAADRAVPATLQRPRWRWTPAALTAAAVVPVVGAVVRAVHQQWFPVGDSALLYLRGRDVLTADHPWLGSWTSASLSIGHDVNNPGPLYSDLIAPFGRLIHGGAGAAVGVGVVNILAVIGISIAALHVGGWRLQRAMLVATAALVWTMGSWLLVDIWQPHALLLPFVLLLLLLLGIALERWRCVPWAVAIGSVVVQTHIAYAYALAALAAVTVVILAVRCGSLRGLRWRRALTGRRARWSSGVFLVLWSQPIIEQLFGSGEGNLARLASGASGGGLKVGVRDATRLTAAVMFQAPWNLQSGFTTAVPRTPLTQTADGPALVLAGIHRFVIAAAILVVIVAVLVLLAETHRRASDVLLATACWFAAASVVAAVVCVAVVTVGDVGLGQHHVRWLWPLTIVVQTIGAWAVLELIGRRLRARDTRGSLPHLAGGLAAALTLVFAFVAIPAFAQPEGPTADRDAMPALRQVFAQLGALRSSSPVLFDLGNLVVYEPYSSAIMMRLQELGISFRVADAPMVRQVGNRRRASGQERTTIFQLEHLDAVTYSGSACRIAFGSSLSADAADTAAADSARIATRLADGAVAVDAARLAADDASTYATITGGDIARAERAVDDGTLSRWVSDGTASIDDDDRAALARISRWVSTAYVLYAVGPPTCPSPDA